MIVHTRDLFFLCRRQIPFCGKFSPNKKQKTTHPENFFNPSFLPFPSFPFSLFWNFILVESFLLYQKNSLGDELNKDV